MLEAVLADFLPLVLALAAAAVIYALREQHRKRTRVNPARPDLAMREAWDLWRAGAWADPDGALLDAGISPGEAVEAQAERSLLETEQALVRSDDPHRALRREIVPAVLTYLYLQEILELGETERMALLKGYAQGMEGLLGEVVGVSALRWIVLRQYARLKYDDAVAEDWFHQFVHVARPYIREKVRLARDYLVELDEGAARLAQIYDELLADLERQLLKVPRKRRFVRPDLADTRAAR